MDQALIVELQAGDGLDPGRDPRQVVGQLRDSTNPADVWVAANSGGGFDVLGSHTYQEEATSLIFSVQAQDTGGAWPVGGSATISVGDAALSGGTLSAPVATEGVPLSNAVLWHFSDADPAGTAADYTATVGWGTSRPPSTSRDLSIALASSVCAMRCPQCSRRPRSSAYRCS